MLTLSFLACFSSGIASKGNDPCPQLTQNLLNRLQTGGEQPSLSVCAKEAMAITPRDTSDKDVTDWYQNQLLTNQAGLPPKIKNLRDELKLFKGSIINIQTNNPDELFDIYTLIMEVLSNPFGRMLAYRILLEIYRLNGLQSPTVVNLENRYYKENKINLDTKKIRDNRINTKQINIVCKPKEDFFFNIKNREINVSLKKAKTTIITINDASDLNTFAQSPFRVDITKQKCPRSVALFHEMLHWFHHLLIPCMTAAACDKGSALLINDNQALSYLFYKDALDAVKDTTSLVQQKNVSTVPWLGQLSDNWRSDLENNKELRFQQEEFLTICGSPMTWKYFVPGLELSENLFRLSLGIPLRFGHRSKPHTESGRVIRALTHNNLQWYNASCSSFEGMKLSQKTLTECFHLTRFRTVFGLDGFTLIFKE